MADSDVSLPKATIAKLIKDMLPDNMKCAPETRDLILECCVEFIHLLSSEANEQCTSDKKKTIAPEHVIKALQTLGFDEYVADVSSVYSKFKENATEKTKSARKLDQLGIPEDELRREQQLLFAKARTALRSSQQGFVAQQSGGDQPGEHAAAASSSSSSSHQ